MRAGHTEAAADLAQLAGQNPADVICEILNEHGGMGPLPDLVALSQRHGLKIGTIADLIAYRRRREKLVECVREQPFLSEFGGKWSFRLYVNGIERREHLALVKGRVDTGGPAHARMHALRLFEYLGESTSGNMLHDSIEEIAKVGGRAVVIIRSARGESITELIETSLTPDCLTKDSTRRKYGLGAQILIDLGIEEIVLLTNSRRHQLAALEGHGLKLIGERAVNTVPFAARTWPRQTRLRVSAGA